MRKSAVFLSGIVAFLVLAGPASAGVAGKKINARQWRQQVRIADGVKSGTLTGKELFRLEREQARIRKQERRFRKDGVLTAWERVELHRSLNRSSRHIAGAKHNDDTE